MVPGKTTFTPLINYYAHADSIFCHARETPGRSGLTAGSTVSYVYESDEKGGKAVRVQVEKAVEESSAMREVGRLLYTDCG